MLDVEAKVVFVHIPRTAGMAVYEALERWATRDRSQRYAYGGEEDWRRQREMTSAQISQLRLIAGHIDFKAFKDDARFRGWLFISVLRDPIRRLLSLYTYVQGCSEHPWYERAAGGGVEEFLDLLEEDEFNRDTQCRMIGGVPDATVALETLWSRFFVAASTEYLAPMMDVLSERIGTHLDVGRVNESSVRIDPMSIAPRALERIRDANRQDAILFEQVRQAGLVGYGARSWKR